VPDMWRQRFTIRAAIASAMEKDTDIFVAIWIVLDLASVARNATWTAAKPGRYDVRID